MVSSMTHCVYHWKRGGRQATPLVGGSPACVRSRLLACIDSITPFFLRLNNRRIVRSCSAAGSGGRQMLAESYLA